MAVIYGGFGPDTLPGSDNNDYISGLDGNDTIDCRAHDAELSLGDEARGDDGTDLLIVNASAETGDVFAGDTFSPTFWSVSSRSNNFLISTSGIELVRVTGGSGNDVLAGRALNDTLAGGAGNDRFNGWDGSDLINGGAGIDGVLNLFIASDTTANLATGKVTNAGNGDIDRLVGIENFTSGNGDDILSGNSSGNELTANGGDDFLYGGGGRDKLAGFAGSDNLFGGNHGDQLFGADGDDILDGGTGFDLLDGGAGFDLADFRFQPGDATVDLERGRASTTATPGGFDRLVSVEAVYTGDGDDELTGNDGDNAFLAGKGDDVLAGGGGEDVLNGGQGSDAASYQTAAAAVIVSLGVRTQQDTKGAGLDTLAGIEHLIGSAAGGDKLTGSGLGNVLIGLGGNDTLSGAGGSDRLTGGAGKDVLIGGLGDDVFNIDGAAESRVGVARDVIRDFFSRSDVIDLGGIDANGKTAGNQAFDFVGATAFKDKAGELHYVKKSGFLMLEGDLNGDGKADFQIEVRNATRLLEEDFVL